MGESGYMEIRHERIRARMREEGLDALIAFSTAKAQGCVRYLSDYFVRFVGAQTRPDGSYYTFGHCAVLFPLEGEPVLLTDQPWDIGRAKEISVFPETHHSSDIGEFFAEKIAAAGYEKVGIDNWFIFPAVHYLALVEGSNGATFTPTMLIEDTYRVKGPDEIANIRRAEDIAVTAVMASLDAVHVGASEHEFALVAEMALRAHGDLELAGSSIISGGANTASASDLPSAEGSYVMKSGDWAMFDICPSYQGYAGDICRMVVAGSMERPRSEAEGALRRDPGHERGRDRDDPPGGDAPPDEQGRARRGRGPRGGQVQDPVARPQPRPRYPRPAGLLLRRLAARGVDDDHGRAVSARARRGRHARRGRGAGDRGRLRGAVGRGAQGTAGDRIMSTSVATPARRRLRFSISASSLWSMLGLPAVTVAMLVYFSAQSDKFFTTSNAQNIARNMAALMLLAVGEAFVILLGEIDISVGAIVGLATVNVAIAMSHFGLIGLLAAPITGLVVGLINGALVATFLVHSVIITIGTMTAIRGLAYQITGGQPATGDFSSVFTWIGTGSVGPFPAPFVIGVGFSVLAILVLRFTRLGPGLYGTGGNEEAARLAGMPTYRLKVAAFAISGLFAGLAGMVLAARIDSGQPNLGQGLELQAIAAAVIGGMALAGGRGAIEGVLMGVLVLTILQNGLDIMNVNSYIQQILTGIIIVLAVVVDQLRGGDLPILRRLPRRGRRTPPTPAAPPPAPDGGAA